MHRLRNRGPYVYRTRPRQLAAQGASLTAQLIHFKNTAQQLAGGIFGPLRANFSRNRARRCLGVSGPPMNFPRRNPVGRIRFHLVLGFGEGRRRLLQSGRNGHPGVARHPAKLCLLHHEWTAEHHFQRHAGREYDVVAAREEGG